MPPAFAFPNGEREFWVPLTATVDGRTPSAPGGGTPPQRPDARGRTGPHRSQCSATAFRPGGIRSTCTSRRSAARAEPQPARADHSLSPRRGGRIRAPDCLREYRQPALRPARRPRARSRGPDRARGFTGTTGSPVPHRGHGARRRRRPAWLDRGSMGHRSAAGNSPVSDDVSERPCHWPRRPCSRLLAAVDASNRWSLRRPASVAHRAPARCRTTRSKPEAAAPPTGLARNGSVAPSSFCNSQSR